MIDYQAELESLRTELTLSQGRELVLRRAIELAKTEYWLAGTEGEALGVEEFDSTMNAVLTQTPEPTLVATLRQAKHALVECLQDEEWANGHDLGALSPETRKLVDQALADLASLLGDKKS